ncbi:nuclear pore complex protein DDB_G0274915-like [Teleopsis dalmanni]|uniref:nuclear pore complex protein DDB_G0274915-like n=1 Tax=Teleopsis dalmanni TaxID=139649 RepID=UPI0018CFED1F|nr:nuclear pore complex protein DDB_G0274915-like [Teleopsis dalmanni]
MRGSAESDLITGNEFLKIFLERDDALSSAESTPKTNGIRTIRRSEPDQNSEIGTQHNRNTHKRNVDQTEKGANANFKNADDKQVVKYVTSGSKIIFLEEYDDDDAVVDAVAREIDLQKEKINTKNSSQQKRQPTNKQQTQKSQNNDEIKVVAVSVSSSSKRSSAGSVRTSDEINKIAEKTKHAITHAVSSQRLQNKQVVTNTKSTTVKPTNIIVTTTTRTTTATPTQTATTTKAVASLHSTTATPMTAVDFINRSHKSEFSIEEAEPLTVLKHRARVNSAANLDTFYDTDSVNSASTNIRNVLAAPAAVQPLSVQTGAYHSSNRNFTSHNQSHINQATPSTHEQAGTHVDNSAAVGGTATGSTSAQPTGVEEKLLPFQTVIYHDTKEGHGPQSRSISYSSISQNVADLHTWQQSGGILAEAQRNVSESLRPIPRPRSHVHTSEPAKFYSEPAKMYGVPAKFYSEPAKVYSEPAKVYGQPEKVYSEPAKVYGQPSKFYSEPAKVYSQPAKVYSEPAKTYWPQALNKGSSTTTSTTTTTTTKSPDTKSNYLHSTRRPAIVSRIAFGESHTTPSTPQTIPRQHPYTSTPTYQQRVQNNPVNSQARRVLFNLDKLPYDLLNAPQQSSKHLLDSNQSKTPQPPATNYGLNRQRPCSELNASTLSNVQQQQQPHQHRHSSLSDQHSNQNAKGLPNRGDLVKCVSKYAHSSAASPSAVSSSATAQATATGSGAQSHFTTERSHIEELYQPTPEQNYEIEESVSVMTNGRAHGVQGISPAITTTPATLHSHFGGRSGSTTYNTNANTNVGNVENVAHGRQQQQQQQQQPEHKQYNSHNDYYDEDENSNHNHNEDDVVDGDGDDVDADSEDGGGNHNKNGNGNGEDEDDAKVAYVVEGRNYRKYRVEEKTDDGFIVGEYGVVDHNDGNLRGVRYTADSTINPSLIQKALLTFLKLK